MINETMTVQERFLAAIALDENVDRHPVIPLIEAFAVRHYGATQGEGWREHTLVRDAMIKCQQDFGYDWIWKPNYSWPHLPGRFTYAPVRLLVPGKHIPEDSLRQIDEIEQFSREDYDEIAAVGWNEFWNKQYPRTRGRSMESLKVRQQVFFDDFLADTKVCEEKAGPVLLGVAVDSPLMSFSMCRTLLEFTKDLYQVPDKVELAMNAVCDDFISNALDSLKAMDKDIDIAHIVLERGSGLYYNLELFERFEWPFIQKYVDAFISEGVVPWLHLDTDWSKNLPYFKQLPKGKCVLDLDGHTDIFNAKEILGGHMCISGDVPAALSTLGTPEEVEAYCKKLIDEVGSGGGFMLTTGCECPIDAKPENVMTMVNTAKSYRGKFDRKLF